MCMPFFVSVVCVVCGVFVRVASNIECYSTAILMTIFGFI